MENGRTYAASFGIQKKLDARAWVVLLFRVFDSQKLERQPSSVTSIMRPFPGLDDASVGCVSLVSGFSAEEFSSASGDVNCEFIFVR